MERGEFTDTVIVAELQPRHFALELEILRFAADQRVGMDMVAHAHPRVIFDDGVASMRQRSPMTTCSSMIA